MENISQARIYVGTYAKYNNGSIFGKWMDLSDYSNKDEFYTACRYLHKDEEDPELMFQDWENIPSDFVGESFISEEIFRIIELVKDLPKPMQEAFYTWLSYTSVSTNDADNLIANFQDNYQGRYDSEEDFAYEIIDSCYDLPEFAKTYFDYNKFANDLFMSDYWYGSGFVFCNC